MGKRKQFIDRKSSVTYHVVHRSKHDPLITDEKAPKQVLVETNRKGSLMKGAEKVNVTNYSNYQCEAHLSKVEALSVTSGTGHLECKPVTIKLLRSVFASKYEEEGGMLNKVTETTRECDPDVVAALEDDFDHSNPDNNLDDDFVVQAMNNENVTFEECNLDLGVDDRNEKDKLEENFALQRFCGASGDTDSFTKHLMSSSSLPRNKHVSLLDEHFERFYKSYDDDVVEPISIEDDTEGIHSAKFILNDGSQCLKNSTATLKPDAHLPRSCFNINAVENEEVVLVKTTKEGNIGFGDNALPAIVSRHPKTIDEPRKNGKIQFNPRTGLPLGVCQRNVDDKLTGKSLAKARKNDLANNDFKTTSCHVDSSLSMLSVLSLRPKNENSEERLKRKRLVKEYRAERRIEKKANTLAFNEESLRQHKVKSNFNLLLGNKIL